MGPRRRRETRPLLRGSQLSAVAAAVLAPPPTLNSFAVPRGFMRIRHFGLLANRGRAGNLATCRKLLAGKAPQVFTVVVTRTPAPESPRCPVCEKGRMVSGPHLSPAQIRRIALRLDSS